MGVRTDLNHMNATTKEELFYKTDNLFNETKIPSHSQQINNY